MTGVQTCALPISVDFIPDKDASLGLVFRLNILWSKADFAALGGRYNDWNNVLDAIYRNLLYKEEIITNVSDDGEVTNIQLSKKDTKIYKYLSLQVSKARNAYNTSKIKRDKDKNRNIWYHNLQKKDIWLRKFMQSLKLYLKETERRPGSVLFGGFGKGKG